MQQPVSPQSFLVWSDGGVSADSLASAACIVKQPDVGLRIKLVTLLDRCPPSEAELVGGILGLCCASLLSDVSLLSDAPPSVRWHCDNLPVVRGGTVHLHKWQDQNWTKADSSEVQAKELWQIFALLEQNIELSGVHSPGHSGIAENEACDKACRWISQDGQKLLSRFGEGRIGRQAELNPDHAWILLDLRPCFQQSTFDLEPKATLANVTDIIRGKLDI